MPDKYIPNKIVRDEYGRVHGILAIDKPVGLTSHDVVNRVRRILQTKKVGHAGSLDPFASGLLLVIVGKATALSDELMASDKSYTGEILFGVATDSHDPEGKILEVKSELKDVTEKSINKVLDKLRGGYTQDVPVYSSIKVDGQKLRVLARKYSRFEIVDNTEGKRQVKFYNEDLLKNTIDLPQHFVEFTKLELTKFKTISNAELEKHNMYTEPFVKVLTTGDWKLETDKWPVAEILADCPKGTYIRQLAKDIGQQMDPATPAMLISLRRVRIGDFKIEDAGQIDDIEKL